MAVQRAGQAGDLAGDVEVQQEVLAEALPGEQAVRRKAVAKRRQRLQVHAARANYDAALCMYHDQALIPVKALHFEDAVNVTLGLPIVRTAPDHGTAFDIAGQDRADPRPMAAAIRMAAESAAHRAAAA